MPRSKKITTVGEKIKTVRLDKKITLDCMANETGFSTNYLKDIENGKIIPPVGALLQIAKALEMNSGFFLKEQENSNLETRVKAHNTRTENYAYTPLTMGSENKHLKAFRIIIDPMTDHKGIGYLHDGEEFVYVLKGKVEVKVGDHVNTICKDESLHFNSGVKHHLRNIENETAELIVIVYSP